MIEDTWAVVVNWNGGEANLACLASLLRQGVAEEHVVFVDNASTDGSAAIVRAAYPRLMLLENERNLGYGAGTNKGIEAALERGAELVLLANNDVVFERGTLGLLVGALEAASDVGVVGPRVVYQDEPNRIWCAGGQVTFRQNLSTMIGHRKLEDARYQRTYDVDYVPGCALLVRREVLEKAGLLEGDYFAYHEDVEFCMKAREAGYRTQVIGEARVLHDAHRTTGGGYNARRKYMMGVNTIWFLRRHGNLRRWLSFFVFDVLSLPFVWALRALQGEGEAVLAKARGTLDGLRGKRVTEEVLQTIRVEKQAKDKAA